MAAASWPLGPNGLAFDREWAVVGPTGGVLRRGRHQRLAAIQPHLDLEAGEVQRLVCQPLTDSSAATCGWPPSSQDSSWKQEMVMEFQGGLPATAEVMNMEGDVGVLQLQKP